MIINSFNMYFNSRLSGKTVVMMRVQEANEGLMDEWERKTRRHGDWERNMVSDQ